MNIHAIMTADAPLPIGPYSQAVWCGGFLFISGQLPIDPKSNTIAGTTIEMQAQQTIKNVLAILASQGLEARSIVKTTVFLRDITHFQAFNKIYEEALGAGVRPARSVVAASALPRDALVEIEAVACR